MTMIFVRRDGTEIVVNDYDILVLEWSLLNMTVTEWRNRHRRCAWCSHCEKQTYTEVDYGGLGYEAIKYYCTAKLKTVDHMTPRPFCRVFEQRKDD